jgi:hypothetical protein
MPIVDLNQMTDWGDNAGDRTPYDIFQMFVSLTKIQGRHSLKVGADIRESRESSVSFGNSGGQYIFREDYVKGPLDNSTAAPWARCRVPVLGYLTGGSFKSTLLTDPAGQVRHFHPGRLPTALNLTINFGLRYEAISAPPNASTGQSPV